MATPDQTAQMIRLALGTLAADNAHHEFEHLCRHVARRRITSNILPATGPVSAGGDQGRDFETFRTYLAEELPFALGFLALASTDVVVFACTIQRDDLKSKFKRDITSICTQGTPVDRICIFAAAKSVPPELRHDLQAWAGQQFDVALDVFDGTALSEFLAEPELYWIAQQYLHLPAELAPPPDQPQEQLPDWYVELRAYWQRPDSQPLNVGDLFDLRRGLRHAIPPGPARADLPGWLTLMTRLAEHTPDDEARLHAVYELVIARGRGTADLRPVEPLIRRFMADVLLTDDPTHLFNASLLTLCCTAAAGYHHTDIPQAEVFGWIPQLRAHVDQLLQQNWGPNTRANLLQVAAHLALHFDCTDVPAGASATLAEIDRQYAVLMQAMEHGTLQQHLDAAPVIDLDTGMRYLLELVELLPTAPTYPVDTLATYVELMAPTLRDHSLYRQVCDGLDEAVRRQEGDTALGRKRYQRAVALHESGRLLEALREYHRAKTALFHGDTLYDAMVTMTHIAGIYSTLGMHLAAKKYALAIAVFATGSPNASDRDMVPVALFAAAGADHLAGAWIASADLTAVAGHAHLDLAPDPLDLDRHPHLFHALDRQVTTALVAHHTRPDIEPTLQALLDRNPLHRLVAAGIQARSATEQRTPQQWLDNLPDTAGAPFSDTGPRRTIIFFALAVRWTVHCRNEHDTVAVLEDFVSTFQIVLVQFASLDPVILPQQVDIEVRTYSADSPPDTTMRTRVNGDRRLWQLYLPDAPPPDPQQRQRGMLDPALRLLLDHSLLDQRHLDRLINDAARDGLFQTTEIGRPYRELVSCYTRPTAPLTGTAHRPSARPEHQPPRGGAPQLLPRTGPGPGYSTEKAHAILAQRYEILPIPIRHTIPALLSDQRVRALFSELRQQGWKDWHLLEVVATLTVRHRLTVRHGTITTEPAQRLADMINDEARRDEQPDDPRVTPDRITSGVMRQGIGLVAINGLQSWGLAPHHSGTDHAQVVRLLADRYGFWTDDILHPDPFDGLVTDGA